MIKLPTFLFIFTLLSILNMNVKACEQVCFLGGGDDRTYCDYYCQADSGGHNSASDYAYSFSSALRKKYDCSVVGSAETSVHCNNIGECGSHKWFAGSDC